MALWGHPSTTGLDAIDFFISSKWFHSHFLGVMGFPSAQDAFSEQLIMLDSLGFYFERPQISNMPLEGMILRDESYYAVLHKRLSNSSSPLLNEIITNRSNGKIRLVLCPQHMPKLHPSFDSVLREILHQANIRVVFLSAQNRKQWRRTLLSRWVEHFHYDYFSRIVWLPNMSPEDFLLLLAAGDIMIDTFPFGGGVTSLEAFALLTPVLTLPSEQTVPALTSGMLAYIGIDSDSTLLQQNKSDYILTLQRLLSEASLLEQMRSNLAKRVWKLFADQGSVKEMMRMIKVLIS